MINYRLLSQWERCGICVKWKKLRWVKDGDGGGRRRMGGGGSRTQEAGEDDGNWGERGGKMEKHVTSLHPFSLIFVWFAAGKCSSEVWVGKRAPRDCGSISANSVTSPKLWSWRTPPPDAQGTAHRRNIIWIAVFIWITHLCLDDFNVALPSHPINYPSISLIFKTIFIK